MRVDEAKHASNNCLIYRTEGVGSGNERGVSGLPMAELSHQLRLQYIQGK